MTFPAWFDLYRDREIVAHPTALRVYANLIAEYPNIFFAPHDVKAWAVAARIYDRPDADVSGGMRDKVNEALELLVERGFALDHGRGMNNVRRLTLVMVRQPGRSSGAA